MAELHHAERMEGVYRALSAFARKAASMAPCDICVVSGCRTAAMQLALWEQGRSTPGPNAGKPGHSSLGDTVTRAKDLHDTAHARGAAIDLMFVRDGELVNNDTDEGAALYRWLGQLGETEGLRWGGRFEDVDESHFEIRHWRALPMVPPANIA